MAQRIKDLKAGDNEYFHRDFHISGDRGVRYVGEKFGDAAVCEYLTRFTKAYYKPLIEKIRKNGLEELKKHIENIYAVEKAVDCVDCSLADGVLNVRISKCPAVTYMKASGYEPSKLYIETTRTVNRVLAEECGYGFEMISYSEKDGAAEYSFFAKQTKRD